MFDKSAEKKAEQFGILERMRLLESDMLKIDGISDINFDIDNFKEIHEVILIPRYDAGPLDGQYYARRREQLAKILLECAKHDLHDSGDRIEDYGEHWYIVRTCGKTWKE